MSSDELAARCRGRGRQVRSSGSAWASSGASFSLWEAFSLGCKSVDFCCFFSKHLLARLRIAKEGFFKDEFYNL